MLPCPKIQVIKVIILQISSHQTLCDGKAPAIYKEDVQFFSWPSKEDSLDISARDK